MQVNDTHKSRRGKIALAIGCVLLQVMLSPNVGMGNGRICFALIYAGVYALSIGGKSAVLAGFFAGLVFDLLSTGPIGLMAGLLTVMSFALGTEERNRFSDGFVASLSTFGVASLAVVSVYHLAMYMFGAADGFVDLLFLRILPTFALTYVAFLPFAYYQVRTTAAGRAKHVGGKAASLRETHYDTRNL